LMPLMPNFWALVGAYVLYYLCTDLNAPLEALKQEIIPPHERGRATGAMQWCTNLASIVFYFVALGRFDDVRFMAGFPFSGEEVIYWSAALLLVVMLLLVMLGIKEIDQKSRLHGQQFSLGNFFGGLADQELWPVYLLAFSNVLVNAGLGPLGNLLYTDQWGYSKQDMGVNVAVGGTLNIFIIGLLTVFADRMNRLRAYRILLVLAVILNASYFCYVTFVLPDQRPSLVEIIVFGETGSIIGMLTNMVCIPLVYDYVRRNKMGTYGAGVGIVSRVTGFCMLNGIGLFIWFYALLFQPPAGEAVRVVLRGGESSRADVSAALRASPWTSPATGRPISPDDIKAYAWQANGTVSDRGRAWEVRCRDGDSEKIARNMEALETEKSTRVAQEKTERDKDSVLERQGKPEAAAEVGKHWQREQAIIDRLTVRIDGMNRELQTRAESFDRQVTQALQARLIGEGEQVLDAALGNATLVEIDTASRPESRALEKALMGLRQLDPNVIDLRPLKLDQGYGVVVSTLAPADQDETALAQRLRAGVVRTAGQYQRDLFPAVSLSPVRIHHETALTLELMVVEDPLDMHISPINRLVNWVLGLFGDGAAPDRRLSAMARSLRVPGGINHVRIRAGAAPKTISITAVLASTAPQAPSVEDGVGLRLHLLLDRQGNAGEGELREARAFYEQIEQMAAAQRITVARPVLAAEYVQMKYNYMSGYIWMCLVGLVGIVSTALFSRLEEKDYVRKRGVEEARAP